MYEGCPRCRTDAFLSSVTVSYDYDRLADDVSPRFRTERGAGIWKYGALLPVQDPANRISLGEGGTPLLRCHRLGARLGLTRLYVKDESRNPTWSFKDRLCSVAVSKGREFDATTTVVSSSGNHGASSAAYSARGGLGSVVFTRGQTPPTFLTLMQVYGAMVVPVTTGEGRWTLMRRSVRELGWYPTGSYTVPMPTGNPFGMEGGKTISYELGCQLNWRAPSKLVMPLGLGEGFFGVWKGFTELTTLDFMDGRPAMIAVEPANAAPLRNALDKGLDFVERVPTRPTVAVSIGGGLTSSQAMHAVKASNGTSVTVAEDEIMAAQRDLATLEGLYAEATSATTIAALKQMVAQGTVDADETVVCVMTSGGLKDPECTRRVLPTPPTIEPRWAAFTHFLRDAHGFNTEERDKLPPSS
jgi:threonine synthase